MKQLFTLLVFFTISLSLSAQDITIKEDENNKSKSVKPIAPYSKFIQSQGFVFVSGQIGIDPATSEMIKGGFNEEVKQVMKNIGAVLEEAGLSYKNIVKCTVYLTDINNYKVMNEVYAGFFEEKYPAREAVQVVKLPKNANIEISVIAAP